MFEDLFLKLVGVEFFVLAVKGDKLSVGALFMKSKIVHTKYNYKQSQTK